MYYTGNIWDILYPSNGRSFIDVNTFIRRKIYILNMSKRCLKETPFKVYLLVQYMSIKYDIVILLFNYTILCLGI